MRSSELENRKALEVKKDFIYYGRERVGYIISSDGVHFSAFSYEQGGAYRIFKGAEEAKGWVLAHKDYRVN